MPAKSSCAADLGFAAFAVAGVVTLVGTIILWSNWVPDKKTESPRVECTVLGSRGAPGTHPSSLAWAADLYLFYTKEGEREHQDFYASMLANETLEMYNAQYGENVILSVENVSKSQIEALRRIAAHITQEAEQYGLYMKAVTP
jgi:hypothetical protein